MISRQSLNYFKVARANARRHSKAISKKSICAVNSIWPVLWNLFDPFRHLKGRPLCLICFLGALSTSVWRTFKRVWMTLLTAGLQATETFQRWRCWTGNETVGTARNAPFPPLLWSKFQTWTISCALVHYRLEIWSHRKFSWFRMKNFAMFRRRAIVFLNCFNKLCSLELKNNSKLSQIRLIFYIRPLQEILHSDCVIICVEDVVEGTKQMNQANTELFWQTRQIHWRLKSLFIYFSSFFVVAGSTWMLMR